MTIWSSTRAALDGKDIHLCVDVYTDETSGQLVFDNNNLPLGLKKLYFQNTQQDVTTIGNYLLYECPKLTVIKVSKDKKDIIESKTCLPFKELIVLVE